jgi:hypothetical protein
MTDREKKKGYEPPQVKEIGGVFEQAMGLSNCVTGSLFTANCAAGGSFGAACRGGLTPAGGCPGGGIDQPSICVAGPTVTGCRSGFRG